MAEAESSPSRPDAESTPPSSWVATAWPYALLLAVGIFVLTPKLGDFGFWDPWEPKYAESAREMIERGDFIVPYYREEVRLAKPILVYWGILAGSAVFGLNEFGARIVGVCMALASMLGVFYAVSLLRGRQAGLISALVLGTAPHFYFISRQAMPDVYLFTSLGSCLIFLCLGLFGPDRRRDLHFGISYACFSLAVLAKGPVIAGVILLTTLVIYGLIRIDTRELWQRERRAETLLYFGTLTPTVALLAGLSVTSFLYGTSQDWWGYSREARADMNELRNRWLEQFAELHLTEVLLGLLVVGAAAAGISNFRKRSSGRGSLAAVVLPAIIALGSAAAFFSDDVVRKLFLASILGVAACALILVASTRRFLTQAWLWPLIQPHCKMLVRQLLLFAAVFLFVAGPWHLAIVVKEGHAYFTDFILKHNVHRINEEVNRSGVSEFYVRVLIFGFFPWSCMIPVALTSLVGWSDRNPFKRYGLEGFLLITSVVTFAAFTIAETKFAHYFSPMIIPMAVLIGLMINRTLETRHSVASRLAWLVAAMLFALPTADLLRNDGIVHLVGSFTMKRWVPDNLFPGTYFHGLLLLAGACILASVVVRSRILVGGLVLSATLLANYSSATFIPSLTRHKTMKHLCETWKEHAPQGDPPICFYGDMKHGIYFYTDYRIQRMSSRRRFGAFLAPENRGFCIVERDTLKTLQQEHRRRHPGQELRIVDNTHFQYVLISNFNVDGPAIFPSVSKED